MDAHLNLSVKAAGLYNIHTNVCFAPFLIWPLPVIAMTYPSLHCWQIGGIPEHLSQYLMLHSRQCWPDHPSSQRHIYFVLLLMQLPYTPHGFPSHGSIIVSHLSPAYPTGHVQPVQLAVTLPKFSQTSEQSKTYIIWCHCMLVHYLTGAIVSIVITNAVTCVSIGCRLATPTILARIVSSAYIGQITTSAVVIMDITRRAQQWANFWIQMVDLVN